MTGIWNLVWVSRLDRSYAVDLSVNLTNWVESVPNVPSQGGTTSLTRTNTSLLDRAFIRVRELGAP